MFVVTLMYCHCHCKCAPSVQGGTKTPDKKPATLEHAPNATVHVPGFINSGDRIVVNLQSRVYVRRAK